MFFFISLISSFLFIESGFCVGSLILRAADVRVKTRFAVRIQKRYLCVNKANFKPIIILCHPEPDLGACAVGGAAHSVSSDRQLNSN